ncbi:MAG: hypothetical protein ACYCUM_12085 [Solirubrobacteraceae bacterium]
MSNLTIPPVPELSDESLAARHDALLAELRSVPQRRWRRVGFAVGGVSAAAAATSLVLALVLAGPGAQRAFAGWSATPTHVTARDTAAARASCAYSPSGAGPDARDSPRTRISPRAWHTVLTDVRGPYVVVVVEAAHGRARMSCLYGPSGSASATTDARTHLLSSSGDVFRVEPQAPPAGRVEVYTASKSAIAGRRGARFSQIEGRTGAHVTRVSVILRGGGHIRASSSHGWFFAWWPGSARAVSAEVRTAGGEHLQPLHHGRA